MYNEEASNRIDKSNIYAFPNPLHYAWRTLISQWQYFVNV